ncbi:MAG TPA: hypothetical protein VF681_12005 [Abditibacteriaceae bacterium]
MKIWVRHKFIITKTHLVKYGTEGRRVPNDYSYGFIELRLRS